MPNFLDCLISDIDRMLSQGEAAMQSLIETNKAALGLRHGAPIQDTEETDSK